MIVIELIYFLIVSQPPLQHYKLTDQLKKIFYEIVALTLSIYNNFFFKKLTVVGKEKIPKDGSIIFSPNHQSALLDPLLVGVTNGKRVYSLTRSDVFRKPFLWVLNAMQTLPIYRIRDGYEKLTRNKELSLIHI